MAKPVLSGAAFARGGRLRVRAQAGELVVRAPSRFIRGMLEWCDGSRDLDALASTARSRWGETRFPSFVSSMLEAGVLLDEPVALARALRAALELSSDRPRVRPALQGDAPSGPSLEPEDLEGLLASLGVVRYLPRNCSEWECALKVLLIVREPAERFTAGLHEVMSTEDGYATLAFRGNIGTSAHRAFRDPLVFEQCRVVLVIAADVDALLQRTGRSPLRDVLLQAGGIADRAQRWATACGLGYLHDLPFEDRLADLCQLQLERPMYVGAFAGMRPQAHAGPTFTVSWEDHAAHADLSIARASAPSPDGASADVLAWGRSYDPRLALGKAVSELAERLALRQACHSIEATAAELPRHVPPGEFARYSERQFADDTLGVAPFVATQRLRWVEGREWSSGESVWLPAECVSTSASAPAGKRVMRVSSSGCAADVDLETAIRRALHEVIERDAFARHWLAQAGGRPIDRLSLSSRLETRIGALTSLDCETSVACTTLGLGPAIMVLIRNHRLGFACVGCASDSDPGNAVERAFIEAEFAALARCHGVRGTKVRPEDACLPEHHANVFAQRAFFRRADVLVSARQVPVRLDLLDWPATLEQRLRRAGQRVPAYWLELPSGPGPRQLDGRPLRTVRALISGCVPLAFGYGALPEGMVSHRVTARARFPHPLA
ncbi:YcaO-like family protein [Ramlibacter sp. AN1133]|uniref:YcaO-like family protein n=1 Tax=Ramlibacter sp. AN1133 TaxID=3133429 RepID=UPI0030C49C36